MNRVDALRILQESLGHSENSARQVLDGVNAYLAEKNKTLESYPTTWFPGLLAGAGEIGKVRLGELIGSDFVPKDTPADVDALLTQAFLNPVNLK